MKTRDGERMDDFRDIVRALKVADYIRENYDHETRVKVVDQIDKISEDVADMIYYLIFKESEKRGR